MIKSYIVKELINEMKDRMPQDQSLASYLINTLCIGKEAAYRRLRGEVAYLYLLWCKQQAFSKSLFNSGNQ